MSSSAQFFKVVGARTAGLKSGYSKQRMKAGEIYMTGYGGHGGHRHQRMPTGESYLTRQTTWMDTRFDAGWGAWLSKMGIRLQNRAKYLWANLAWAMFCIFGIWEFTVHEHQRYERAHYY